LSQCQSHAQNKKVENLATAWQPYGINVQLQTLYTRWQLSADQQEHNFMGQRIKLNVGAKGENYTLMWTKAEFCGILNMWILTEVEFLQ
jgi:hypothetical protein